MSLICSEVALERSILYVDASIVDIRELERGWVERGWLARAMSSFVGFSFQVVCVGEGNRLVCILGLR